MSSHLDLVHFCACMCSFDYNTKNMPSCTFPNCKKFKKTKTKSVPESFFFLIKVINVNSLAIPILRDRNKYMHVLSATRVEYY